MLHGLDLILYKNIYIAHAKKILTERWTPPSEPWCPRQGCAASQGTSLSGTQKYLLPSTKLPVALVQELMGWGGLSSCIFGENGLFSAFAGGTLTVPVASAPEFCVFVLMVYEANRNLPP